MPMVWFPYAGQKFEGWGSGPGVCRNVEVLLNCVTEDVLISWCCRGKMQLLYSVLALAVVRDS